MSQGRFDKMAMEAVMSVAKDSIIPVVVRKKLAEAVVTALRQVDEERREKDYRIAMDFICKDGCYVKDIEGRYLETNQTIAAKIREGA